MGPQFFQTYMGKKFYERTMPKLVEEAAENEKKMGELKTALDEQSKAIKELTIALYQLTETLKWSR